MNRRFTLPLIAAAIAVAAAVAVSAATHVTFVFKNGTEKSGEFSYHHDTNYNLIINGAEQVFPSDDIALIKFVPGTPPAAEIADLSHDANPTEHERHMIAFKGGRTLRGKIYDFQGDNLLIDARDGNGNLTRQTFLMSQIARLYISAPASRDLFPSATTPATPVADGTVVKVSAQVAWTDTGIMVTQGQLIAFSTGDQINVAPGTPTGPGGTGATGKASLPLKTLGTGALIGRIASTARVAPVFAIGGNTAPIAMPASGKLLLGINDNVVADNSGVFNVAIRLARPAR